MFKTVCWFINEDGINFRLKASVDFLNAMIERFSPAGREIFATGDAASVVAQYEAMAAGLINEANLGKLEAWKEAAGWGEPAPMAFSREIPNVITVVDDEEAE